MADMRIGENQTCNFDNGDCNLSCKKYPMCSYMSIQKQITALQQQINFLYNSLNNIINSEVKLKDSVDKINEKIDNYTCEVLDIINLKKIEEN